MKLGGKSVLSTVFSLSLATFQVTNAALGTNLNTEFTKFAATLTH